MNDQTYDSYYDDERDEAKEQRERYRKAMSQKNKNGDRERGRKWNKPKRAKSKFAMAWDR